MRPSPRLSTRRAWAHPKRIILRPSAEPWRQGSEKIYGPGPGQVAAAEGGALHRWLGGGAEGLKAEGHSRVKKQCLKVTSGHPVAQTQYTEVRRHRPPESP